MCSNKSNSQKPPEAVSEVIKLKIFLGEHALQTPLVWVCYAHRDSITMDCIPPPGKKILYKILLEAAIPQDKVARIRGREEILGAVSRAVTVLKIVIMMHGDKRRVQAFAHVQLISGQRVTVKSTNSVWSAVKLIQQFIIKVPPLPS